MNEGLAPATICDKIGFDICQRATTEIDSDQRKDDTVVLGVNIH